MFLNLKFYKDLDDNHINLNLNNNCFQYPDIMESVLDCVEAITSRCLDILTHMVGQPNDQEIKQLEVFWPDLYTL